MKTIPRSHKKRIAAIKEVVTGATVYSLRNDFHGAPADLTWLWDQYENHGHGKLVDRGEQGYRIDVHGNLWYELTTA